jgi:hypothetical protein
MEGTVFELGGGREMVSGARATELLAHAMANPTTLRLSNKSFSIEVATHLLHLASYFLQSIIMTVFNV